VNELSHPAAPGKGIRAPIRDNWPCSAPAAPFLPSPRDSATPVTGSGDILSGSSAAAGKKHWKEMAGAAGPADRVEAVNDKLGIVDAEES
jgi:hypothetical protein